MSMKKSFGGSAANTIVALARLGKRVGFIGNVGNDEEGKEMLRDFEKEKVDTTGIKKINDKTGLALCFVDSSGERALYVYPGANNFLSIDEERLNYAKKAEILHLSSFVGGASIEEQKKLVEEIKDVKISFAPGELYASKGLEFVKELLSESYVVFLNKREIKLLTGKNYEEGAEELLRIGAKVIAITLGEKGCYIASKKEKIKVKAFPTEVIDTTGAGDAFAAGFLLGLLEGKDLYECGKIGNKVASLCISKVGAREGLPSREFASQILK